MYTIDKFQTRVFNIYVELHNSKSIYTFMETVQ